ncbi:MAG: molybdopterin-dependent oxidoreductase [Candidatus Bathyarchaeia archaeon]
MIFKVFQYATFTALEMFTPRCVIVCGANIVGSGAADGMCGIQLLKTVNRGAKLIIIDPRRIMDIADVWAPIRLGTDAFLALAMLHVIIEEKLYDKEFVDKWTFGFNELAERVKAYSPENVEETTWIPAEITRKIARTYASTKLACILWGVGIDQSANNFQTARAILCLMGITGNLDVPGGNVLGSA